MAGQAALLPKHEVEAKIRSIECNKNSTSGNSHSKESMKTTNKK